MSQKKAILVTGGAGFIGSHFVRLASDAGREVVILDDLSGGLPSSVPATIPLVVGDIGDAQVVRRICAVHRVGSVVHFATRAQAGPAARHPGGDFDINVVRTLSMLNTIREQGVRACLFASSAAVYGKPRVVPIPEFARREPATAIGATKLAAELALDSWGRAYQLRWAALRQFNAAGAHPDGTLRENHEPETHLIPLAIDAALGLRPPLQIFGEDYDTHDGTCIRDYIHVQDLVAAHLLALTRLEQGDTLGAVNIGSGRGYSVREVIDATGAVLGRAVPAVVAPRREGDAPRLVADPMRAFTVLGWKPKCSDLATIIDDAVRSRRGRRALITGKPARTSRA